MLDTDNSMWFNITTEPGKVSGPWMVEETKEVMQRYPTLALMTPDYFQHLFFIQQLRLLVTQNSYEA